MGGGVDAQDVGRQCHRAHVAPSGPDDGAAAVQGLDDGLEHARQVDAGHAAKAHVDGRRARVEKLCQFGRGDEAAVRRRGPLAAEDGVVGPVPGRRQEGGRDAVEHGVGGPEPVPGRQAEHVGPGAIEGFAQAEPEELVREPQAGPVERGGDPGRGKKGRGEFVRGREGDHAGADGRDREAFGHG